MTIAAEGAQAAELECLSDTTVYTLTDLPDAVTVRSSGCLVLADADGIYGHMVVEGTVYVIGEQAVLAASATVAAAYAADGTERLGSIRLDGSADSVVLARGCTLSGSGTVTTLRVKSGVVLDTTSGVLTVGTAEVGVPDFESIAWAGPYAAMTASTAVTVFVDRRTSGQVLKLTVCGECVTFVLPDTDAGTLEFRDGGLWYTPAASGYRLRLR